MNSDDLPSGEANSDIHPQTSFYLSLARRGDAQGFAELYERIAPALFGWASLRIQPALRSRLDPADLVQEVWWRAMDSFPNYDAERSNFRRWLFSIANHTLFDAFRRFTVRGQMPAQQEPGESGQPEDLVAEVTSISERVARDEGIQQLIDAAVGLNEDDRRVLVHCGLEGLTVAAAAKLIGISEDATAKRWQRLRAKMADSPTWKAILSTFEASEEDES